MSQDDNNNVIRFPTKPAIFSPPLRQKLEVGIKDFTDKPNETITEVEQIICTHIIAGVRALMTRLGERVGKNIGERVING